MTKVHASNCAKRSVLWQWIMLLPDLCQIYAHLCFTTKLCFYRLSDLIIYVFSICRIYTFAWFMLAGFMIYAFTGFILL